MKIFWTALFVLLIASGCGGGGDEGAGAFLDAVEASLTETEDRGTAASAEPAVGADIGDVVTPEGSGDLPMNSIRIGDRIWTRTMPMTRGQCFVVADNVDDNRLPASSSIWGTLDGDDDIRFSASMDQKGGFEALVDDQETFHWLAGERATNLSEITFTFDYENNISRGEGIFWNAFTSERAHGSFAFQCDPT